MSQIPSPELRVYESDLRSSTAYELNYETMKPLETRANRAVKDPCVKPVYTPGNANFKFMQLYRAIENLFEKMSNMALRVFSNSLVFMAALGLTAFWFCVHDWHTINMSDAIHDIIIAITFLSFFIIQRTFTHFSQALHLKVNELVTA